MTLNSDLAGWELVEKLAAEHEEVRVSSVDLVH